MNPILGNSCARFERLPVPGVPLLWHGVQGKNMREGNSPSWFNPDEASIVFGYVRDLLESPLPITPADIGIISPYNKQVRQCSGKGGLTETIEFHLYHKPRMDHSSERAKRPQPGPALLRARRC